MVLNGTVLFDIYFYCSVFNINYDNELFKGSLEIVFLKEFLKNVLYVFSRQCCLLHN